LRRIQELGVTERQPIVPASRKRLLREVCDTGAGRLKVAERLRSIIPVLDRQTPVPSEAGTPKYENIAFDDSGEGHRTTSFATLVGHFFNWNLKSVLCFLLKSS
jgi:hypothetical protein